jgi:hypothetical protein
MEFYTPNASVVGFRAIHPLVADLIRVIPDSLNRNRLSAAAEARLFPEPTHDPAISGMRADWNAFVTPDLQSHFQSARDIVSADLRRFTSGGEMGELQIPLKHADAWLNVLNQIRLSLAAEINFDEAALESGETPDLLSERGMIVFRINLYAFMQQCLVDALD